MLETFSCPSCHGSLDLPDPPTPAVSCPYCGTTVIVPEELLATDRSAAKGRRQVGRMGESTAQIERLVAHGRKIEAVKLFRETFGVGLREAKEAVDAMERRGAGQVQDADSPTDTLPQFPAGRGCRGCRSAGILLLVLIVAGIGFAVYFALNDPDLQGSFSSITSAVEEAVPINVILNGPSTLIPGVDGAPSDVVFLESKVNNEESTIVYLDGESQTTLWESEAFPGSATSTEFFVFDELILSFTENKVGAYRVENGAQAWQVTLSDRIPYTCESCVAVYDSHVVALTADGQLQALSTKDGSPAWQKRVSGPGLAGFLNLGDQVAVLNEDEDEQMGLELFDPATGKLVRRLDPRCDNMPGPARGPGVYEPVILDRADNSVYFVFGFFDPLCAQKWDYQTGQQIWGDFSDISSVSGNPVWLDGSDSIFIAASGNELYAISKLDGSTTLLHQEEDHELVPLEWGANVLLVQATRKRGSARDELWAIDSRSGEILWRHVPQADTMMAAGGLGIVQVDRPGQWAAHMAPQGVFLFQARHQPPRLLLETLNLSDGASSGQTELPLEFNTEVPYWMALLGWSRDGLWLKLDAKQIWSIDPVNAEMIRRWP